MDGIGVLIVVVLGALAVGGVAVLSAAVRRERVGETTRLRVAGGPLVLGILLLAAGGIGLAFVFGMADLAAVASH